MIWMKAIAGVNTWCRFNFDRRSIESYYIITFVYQTYEFLSNALIFSCQPNFYGEYIVPLVCVTALIGLSVVLTLERFLHFLERVEYKHQTLWCGDVVDSSDEEEANKAASKAKDK